MDYDLVIIGGGPAGLSAGIYAKRRGLKLLLITKEFGERAMKAHKIDNYLGLDLMDGPEFVDRCVKHARRVGVQILEDEVMDADSKGKTFIIVTASGKKFSAKSLILATGISDQGLGVPGEKELLGKGVSYCATCDAPLFRNSKVIVIGSGNLAGHAALVLKGVTDKVEVIDNCDCSMDKNLLAQLKKNKIPFRKAKIEKILGKGEVTGVMVDGYEEKVEGIFIELGTTPTVDLAAKLGVMMDGRFIEVNKDQATNVPGIFAAGDVTGGLPQMITAAAQGAIAGTKAADYVIKSK